MNKAGRALLCDFGLSQVLEETPSGLTTTTSIGLTTRYGGPELFEDNPCRTLPSDIWAWGCLLLVVRTRPHTSRNLGT